MNIKAFVSAMTLTAGLCATGSVVASDTNPAHFKGKTSDTLEQAVANFKEYNKKVKQELEADELTPFNMVEIHELTYTLEIALAKIHTELGKLKDVLEELHTASENMDSHAAKEHGEAYLKIAETVIK